MHSTNFPSFFGARRGVDSDQESTLLKKISLGLSTKFLNFHYRKQAKIQGYSPFFKYHIALWLTHETFCDTAQPPSKMSRINGPYTRSLGLIWSFCRHNSFYLIGYRPSFFFSPTIYSVFLTCTCF